MKRTYRFTLNDAYGPQISPLKFYLYQYVQPTTITKTKNFK